MKKRGFLVLCLLLSLISIAALANVEINETNFPDSNFRDYIRSDLDDGDNVFTDEEISEITKMTCDGREISSLKGIEHFISLKKLYCSNNQLTALDLSGNTALTYLDCHKNQMTALDLSGNTDLTYLACGGNQLKTLDVSRNTALTSLYCNDNLLTALDVSNNTGLKVCTCYGNQLTALDVTNNPVLASLSCGKNQLTELDVSQNTELTGLHCDRNQLTSLDVTYNTWLTWFNCFGNSLTSLDLSKNTSLTELDCQGNQLTALDVSSCPELAVLSCPYNQLTLLKTGQNTKLTDFHCNDNNLTALDVSGCTGLVVFSCSHNELKELDISKNTELIYLECGNNQLNSLDVSGNPALNKMVLEKEPTDNGDNYVWEDEFNYLYVDKSVQIITTEGVFGEPTIVSISKIILNKTKAILTRTGRQKNPALQLKVKKVRPENATDTSVIWTSSAPKIARVDKTGKVTALKAGKATITAMAADGSGVKATCTITVKDAKVTRLTLNKTRVSLKKGKTLQLKVKKFTPASPLNQKVTWKSSDKKVAKVDKNGKVTAVKAGICEIICTAAGNKKVTARVKITVK